MPFVPGRPKFPVTQVEKLLEVGVQRRVPALLDAELDPDDHRPRREDHVDRALDVGERDVGVRHPRLDRRSREHGAHVLPADGVPGEELGGLAATLEDDRQHRGEQEGVRAGAKRQVEVGDVRDLRAPRVDHDHAAAGRLLDLVHLVPRPLEAVRHPGIAPEHDEQVGVLDVLRRVAELVAEEPPVHPEVAGLLLRERVEVLRRAEQRRGAPGSTGRRGGCPARRRRRMRTPRRRARRGSRSGERRSR